MPDHTCQFYFYSVYLNSSYIRLQHNTCNKIRKKVDDLVSE